MSDGDEDQMIAETASAYLTSGRPLASGWCAPSDNVAILPEVTARRGGISFTSGPDLENLTDGSERRYRKLKREQRRRRDRRRAMIEGILLAEGVKTASVRSDVAKKIERALR